MWRSLSRMRSFSVRAATNPSFGHDDRFQGGQYNDMLGADPLSVNSGLWSLSDGMCRKPRMAYMDDEANVKSTYWMRELDKSEEADPNR